MFGEKAETDQVYLSIFVNDKGLTDARELDPKEEGEELAPNEIRRVWLHYMLDIATRYPLAWVLSETADSDASMSLMRMATRDKTKEKIRYGCKSDPAKPVNLSMVLADNGTATRNGRVYAGQLGAGMTVMTGRTYHANDKPHVESAFGGLQWQVIAMQHGYVGSRPAELPGYDPKAAACLTLDDLYGLLTRYFVDEYPLFGIFMVLGWVSSTTAFAAMGTASGAAPLLTFCIINLRG